MIIKNNKKVVNVYKGIQAISKIYKGNVLVWIKKHLATITGTTPITLAKATVDPVQSMKLYGMCQQNGTPTLSNPVPIYCNNGEIKVRDSEIPGSYKRLLGLTMNNNCYYAIADFRLKGSDTIRFSFMIDEACNVLGSYSGSATGNNYSLYASSSRTAKYLRYKDGAYNSSVDTDTRYDVVITPTGSIGMKTDETWTQKTFTTTTDLFIGTTSATTTSAKLKGTLYGNIIVDGRLKLIPVERIADGHLGYYDTYSETFYDYIGTNPISLGYDTSNCEIYVEGTPEIVEIENTADGAIAQILLAVGEYKDMQEIISGSIIRNCEAICYDGTQTINIPYISNTGGLNVGSIIVHPKTNPTSESVAGQPLTLQEGTNIVSSNKGTREMEIKYYRN